jgi:Transglycosylase-like domain
LNPSYGVVAKPKLRTVGLVLAAALAVLATSLVISTAPAAAASGGVSPNGDAGSDTGSQEPSASDAKYVRLWDKVSRRDRRWARSTSKCESGGDPKAIGGGGKYRGAFQFLKSTWRNSPKSPGGDPIRHSYRTQAVVAVALKRRDGAGHWPNCG